MKKIVMGVFTLSFLLNGAELVNREPIKIFKETLVEKEKKIFQSIVCTKLDKLEKLDESFHKNENIDIEEYQKLKFEVLDEVAKFQDMVKERESMYIKK